MNLDDVTLARLELLRSNLPLFAETCLKVVTADGKLEPLIFNESQIRLHNFIENQKKEIGMVRCVVLKGRKQGVSTYTAARYFHQALFAPYKNVFILSHHSSTTKVLFDIVSTFYENLPPQLKLKLKTDNSKELQFDNNSKYTTATAGEGEIGRGSTPHYFHGSEVASFENADALQTGILEAVAMEPDTEMVMESTAKGVGNMFHAMCMDGIQKIGLFRTFFLPWYVHEKNRFPTPKDFQPKPDEIELQRLFDVDNDQLYWRRLKMAGKDEWKFKQEFPSTIQEAFQTSGETLLDAKKVHAARKSVLTDKSKAIVIGVDPARDGDRTIIAFRQGRHIFRIDRYKLMDAMKLTGILGRLINELHPAQVFIDTAHGYGTMDRLHELGFGAKVTGVNFGESPMNTERFANKRAEMALTLRDWLQDEARLPDEDDIELDLLSVPPYKENSSGRILLEPKEAIKKKFGRSPDIFDAIILTFAYPVRETVDKTKDITYTKDRSKKSSASPVMDAFARQGRRSPTQWPR